MRHWIPALAFASRHPSSSHSRNDHDHMEEHRADKTHGDEAMQHRAGSYASFAASAALIFGFGVSVLWEGVGSDASLEGTSTPLALAATMALSVATSGYSLTVHSIQHNVLLTLMSSSKYSLAQRRQWSSVTSSARTAGRYCLWLSLGFFMVGTVLRVLEKLPRRDALVSALIVCVATVAIFFTVVLMRPSVLLKENGSPTQPINGHATAGAQLGPVADTIPCRKASKEAKKSL